MKTGLHRLLETMAAMPDEPIHRVALVEQLGPQILAAVEELGLFGPAGESDRFPCPGSEDGCPRMVARDLKPGTDKPHWAGCTNGGVGCEHLFVSSAELETLTLSTARWWTLLQEWLNLDDQMVRPDPTVDRAWNIGTQLERGAGREVLVMMGHRTRELALELPALRARYGRALALLPVADSVPTELIQSHRTGSELEVAFIQDRLRFDDGRLWWREPQGVVAEDPSRTQREDVFCVAFDGQRHNYTRDQYDRAVAEAEKRDFFLDITESQGAFARGGRRIDGVFVPAEDLRLNEGKILAHLMLIGKPQRPSQLRLTEGDADHVSFLNRARRKIDVSEGRYRWRFFIGVGSGDEREVHFNPEPKYRFLLLCRPEFAGRRRA